MHEGRCDFGQLGAAMIQLPAQYLAEIVEALRRQDKSGGGREKRRFARVVVSARVKVRDEETGREFVAVTRDFSSGGLGLMQSVPSAGGGHFAVTLPRAREGPLMVRCRVTYASELADGVWGVGAQFMSVVAVKPAPSTPANPSKPAPGAPLSPMEAEARRIQREILS
jgi:hypothetical protein